MTKGRVFVISIVLFAVVALFASCNQDVKEPEKAKGHGTLQVSVGKVPDVADYKVYIKSSTTSYSNAFQAPEGLCKIDALEEGDYIVYAQGLDADGNAILRSEEGMVSIKDKQTSSIALGLDLYVEGSGTLQLTVDVANDSNMDEVVLSLFDSKDESLLHPVEHILENPVLSSDGRYLGYSIELELDAGRYFFTIGAFHLDDNGDREQIGSYKVGTFDIFKATTRQVYVSPEGNLPQIIPAPSIYPEGGLCKEGTFVSMESDFPTATIYYTTDGTDPSTDSIRYIKPISIDRCMTIKAIAVVEGFGSSTTSEESYRVKVEDPAFSIKDKSLVSFDRLELATSTKDATIWYTMDGTEPSSENGTKYTAPITLRRTVNVKAVAIKEGLEPSNVVSAQYYDRNSSSPERFFVATDKGAISINDGIPESEIPEVLIIPSTWNGIDVVEIAAGGFAGLTGVQNILLPDSIRKIGANAFTGCIEIESIDIGKYVEDIAGSAFVGWNEDQRINDYSGQIRANTLNDCNARIYATVKTETQVVSGYTGMKNLYGITLNNNITTIAENAFSGCVNLEEFVLPSYVTTIGSLAFNDCTKIKSITLPKTLSSLAVDAFTGWTNEQRIEDESGLTLNMRFFKSKARIYAKMPLEVDGVAFTKIQDKALSGRDDIYGLEISGIVDSIGDYAFEDTSIECLVIPATVKTLGLELFKGWNSSQKVVVNYNNYEAKVSEEDYTTPFTGTDAAFEVSICNGVFEIGENAFNGMASLKEIVIPESIYTIKDYAFKGTALKTLSTGENVVSIGDGSFMGCTSLESVVFDSNLESIGDKAFANCSSIKGIKLPDSVKTIGNGSFANCAQLVTVDLGLGVTSIPSMAFIGSGNLKTITAPNCMGSLVVTVKVPLNQLIVHDMDISVIPTYASIEGFSTSITRDEQTIDGNYRVFTFEIPNMLGLDYTVYAELKDFQNEDVGSGSTSGRVYSGNQSSARIDFYMNDLKSRAFSNTVITPSTGIILDGAEIAIENADANAVYYTLDGSDPSPEKGIGELYTEPIALHSFATVKAIAIKEGYAHSSVASTDFNGIKALPPEFQLDSSVSYPSTQYVEIKSSTEDATILYTTNGSDPSKVGKKYDEPIEVGKSMTIRAVSSKDGFVVSNETSRTYEIVVPSHEVETPVVRSMHIEKSIVEGAVVFKAVLNPSSGNTTYEWYLDGDLVGTGSSYSPSSSVPSGSHIVEAVVCVDGISYSDYAVFNYSFGYRVDLNEEWVKDETYHNPDSSLLDGVYRSNWDYNKNTGDATMYVNVSCPGVFSIYVRSNAYATYNYVKVFDLDSTSIVKYSTSGKQNTSNEIDGYTLVSFDVPNDGKEHVITITYLKSSAHNLGENRGFVLIPRIQ